MEGYVKAYRKTLHSSVWSDPDLFRLWMYCLLKATHKKRVVLIGRKEIELSAGEFVTGRFSLFEEFNRGVAPQKVVKELTLWRLLKLLETMGNLNIKSTNKYSVVSIVNWVTYQEGLTTNEQQMNNKRTTNEQQLNTNKNVKNVKNEKNDNKKDIKPSRQKYIFDEVHLKLADHLYERILENNPNHKKPNLESWANELRKMMDLDKRRVDQIEYVIDWVQNDSFWSNNILSPAKLREKYDQLVLKIKADHEKKNKQLERDTRKPKAFQSLENWAEGNE